MYHSNRIGALLVLASVFPLGFVGCGAQGSGGGGSGNGGDPPRLPPPLVIADDPVPDAEGRILLPPGYEGVRPGSGLITGNGTHLYKIEDIEVMPDGSLRISTSQGSLAQLGVAGEFRFVDPPDGTPAEKRGPRLFGPDVNLQILDVSMPFSTTVNLTDSGSVTATVEGLFEMEGEFHLAFDVGLFSGLRTFSTYIAGDVFLDLDVSVEARIAATVAREEAVTERFRTYYHGVIGTFPYYVLVEVTSQLFIGFEGNVEGDALLETGVHASAAAKVGASYDSSRAAGRRWSTIAEAGFEWGYDQPVVCFDGSGSLRAYLRPHFEVQLYTVVGPTFDIEPYGRLDASMQGCLGDPAAEYDVTLTVGAVGYAKIKADILDIFVLESPRMTVFDVSGDVWEWQNPRPPPDPDGCPFDPNKTSPGVCGCGASDVDSDGDGTPNCIDGCPNDRNKTSPGTCDCGNPEVAGCGTYELTTSTVGAGSVSPSSGTYEAGTVVELIASPSAGWYFDHWEGDLSGSSPTRTVTMTVRREVVAVFEQTPPPPPDCDPACEEGFECDDGECVEDDLVVICHIPPGNPRNAHTIVINESALPAHLAHGDTLGPCCTTDEDCDDGLFCNGQELCIDDDCASGTDPCAPGDTCDQDTNECVPSPDCTTSGECDDGLFCNGIETCDFGTDGIGTCVDGIPPCDPDTETCDEEIHACEADGGFCDDFEDGVIDPSLWAWGGHDDRGVGGGSWQFSHQEIVDTDGYLKMRVWGPTSSNSHGAEAWVRTTYDYNDGSSYTINFRWATDVNASHVDMYAIQIADGSIPGGDDLFWYGGSQGSVDGPGWKNLYFQYHQLDMAPTDWSMHIDGGTDTATLYDGPNLTGQILGQKALPSDQAWYVRLIHSDATSAGFPAGDNLLNLYNFCSVPVPTE